MKRMMNVYEMFKQAITDYVEDSVPRYAASIAFFTIFSIAPILTLTVGIVGTVLGDEAARGEIVTRIEGFTGEEIALALQSILAHETSRSGGVAATVVAVLVLFWGASRVFAELQEAMNNVWGVSTVNRNAFLSFIWKRLLSFAMVLLIGVILLGLLIVTAVVGFIGKFAADLLPFESASSLIPFANFVVSLTAVAVLFALIFRIMPDAKVAWRDVWFGAAITALLFAVGKSLIGIYLVHASPTSAFGAAGSFMVFLIWVFYSVQIFFFGAELTQAYAERFGSGVKPVRGAELADTSADASAE